MRFALPLFLALTAAASAAPLSTPMPSASQSAPLPAAAPRVSGAPSSQQVSATQITISGWRLDCSSASGALVCQLFNQVAIRGNNAVIGAISIRRPSGTKTPVMIVQVPEGTALDDAVRVGFTNGAVETLAFYTCNRSGCFARGPVGEPMLNALRAGKQPLRIAYEILDSNAKKQTVTVTLGLDGFATAYERLH